MCLGKLQPRRVVVREGEQQEGGRGAACFCCGCLVLTCHRVAVGGVSLSVATLDMFVPRVKIFERTYLHGSSLFSVVAGFHSGIFALWGGRRKRPVFGSPFRFRTAFRGMIFLLFRR